MELGYEPWPTGIVCPDCKRHEVVWAEGGYTPGHRMCPCCGSHFELTTERAERVLAGDEPIVGLGSPPPSRWILRRARFYA